MMTESGDIVIGFATLNGIGKTLSEIQVYSLALWSLN